MIAKMPSEWPRPSFGAALTEHRCLSDPAMQECVKFGILAGLLIAGLAGYIILRLTYRRKAAAAS